MTDYQRQGTFDDLNNALQAQLDRLMSATGEDVDTEIRRSKAVGNLAANINANMSNAVRVAQILSEDGFDMSGLRATMPRMLGGGDGGQ